MKSVDNPKPDISKGEGKPTVVIDTRASLSTGVHGGKPTVSVVGAAGYTGLELIRLLQHCDQFELSHIIGDRTAGQLYSEVYPAFRGVIDTRIESAAVLDALDSDFVVLALPHGKSAEVADQLISRGYKGGIVDMGSDLRLKSVQDYVTWYGAEHQHPNLLDAAVYGLTEFNRDAIRSARLVANPGCFASAIQLGVLPLIKAGVRGPFHSTGLTGSTGSGVNPSAGTHFTTRDGNLKAYKVLDHQHMGEIRRQIGDMGFEVPEIHFVPVSAPFSRGIWITISVKLDGGGQLVAGKNTADARGGLSSAEATGGQVAALSAEVMGSQVAALFAEAYNGCDLIRFRDGLPELKSVVGTAFTDIGWVCKGDTLIVGVAIDNLGKGAAGQAIQNLNVMSGLNDSTGLRFAGQIL